MAIPTHTHIMYEKTALIAISGFYRELMLEALRRVDNKAKKNK